MRQRSGYDTLKKINYMEDTDVLLIENGYVIDPKSGQEGKLDVLVEGEKIRKIGENLRNTLLAE